MGACAHAPKTTRAEAAAGAAGQTVTRPYIAMDAHLTDDLLA